MLVEDLQNPNNNFTLLRFLRSFVQVMDQGYVIGSDPTRGTDSAVAMGRVKKVPGYAGFVLVRSGAVDIFEVQSR